MSLLHLLSFTPMVLAAVAIVLVMFFAAPILKACDLIEGRLWAFGVIALIGMLCTAGLQVAIVRAERDTAREEAKVAKANYEALEKAVKAQKEEAAAKLAAMTAERDRLQTQMNEARRAQEIKDANNQAAIDKAHADLRAARAAHAGRLRDPNAAGCGSGGGGAQGGPRPGSQAGAGDSPQAGGLLSAQLSGLLERLTAEADEVNRAYAACRADAYTVRGLPAPADPQPEPTP